MKKLDVKRNEAYLLIMTPDGVETSRLVKPKALASVDEFIAKGRRTKPGK